MINKNLKDEILQHFPEKYHDLLKKQILIITDTIEKNQMKYTYSSDFKLAIDIIITDILTGKYLGINPLEK